MSNPIGNHECRKITVMCRHILTTTFTAFVFTYFCQTKNRVMLFLLWTTVARFLHLIVQIYKLFIDHYSNASLRRFFLQLIKFYCLKDNISKLNNQIINIYRQNRKNASPEKRRKPRTLCRCRRFITSDVMNEIFKLELWNMSHS